MQNLCKDLSVLTCVESKDLEKLVTKGKKNGIKRILL